MNDDVIIVCCLGMRQHFVNRSEAIQRFYNAMENCNNSLEYDSYAKIFCQLMEGNGYTMVLMPIKNTEVDKNTGETKHMPITDFDNI